MDLPAPATPHSDQPLRKPAFSEALRFWLKLGFISFGGPAGQIAIMHTELVERRRWIDNDRFLHALNFCMLLPGPEAQQLATYCGWLLHRTRGGIAAGVLFVLPSAILLWLLSWLYVAYGSLDSVAAAFAGLKPAVLAIVAAAVMRIGKKALRTPARWAVAALAYVAIFFFGLPFPIIIASAGVAGWFFFRDGGRANEKPPALADRAPLSWRRSLGVLMVCLVLWWTPVLLAMGWLGQDHTVTRQSVFFSKAAMVTFGGAYAVLPYVAQRAVDDYGWLAPGQMLDGLGLAETTPGPLIMVLQFVGFVGAWQHPGALSPLLSATLGAALTTWVTFLPCFLWIFLGAPFVERAQGHRALAGALSAITAAVVGVILNLAVWFGVHLLWQDGRVNGFGAAVCLAAFAAMVKGKIGVPWIVAGGCITGLVQGFVTGFR